MIKGKQLFFAALAGLALSSCSDEKNEYHMFAMPVPEGSQAILYADQERDSMVIISTDSWVITPQGGDWLSFSETSYDIPVGYQATRVIGLTFPANTSGESRTVEAWVKANGRSYMKQFTQRPYMNIVRPMPVAGDEGDVAEHPDFVLTDSFNVTRDSIEFYTYAQSVELESNAEWLTPGVITIGNKNSKGAKKCTAVFNMEQNRSVDRREAELKLKASNGASTVIRVVQQPVSHLFEILVPEDPQAILYADQEKDSMVIVSTDSWKITPQGGNWLRFSETSYDIPEGTRIVRRLIELSFSANKSGQSRTVETLIEANGHSYTKQFTQRPYMNIVRPMPVAGDEGDVAEHPDFVLTDSFNVTRDSIEFYTYAQSVELESNAEWLTPEVKKIDRGQDDKRKKKCTVKLRMEQNDTVDPREAELKLNASNGASTVIKVVQLPKKKEE